MKQVKNSVCRFLPVFILFFIFIFPSVTAVTSPYDVSEAVFSGDFINFTTISGGITTDTTGLYIKFDGSQLYRFDPGTDLIYQYSITTGNLSSAVYQKNFSVASQSTNGATISFSATGHRMFLGANNNIYQYNLGTAWDIGTAVYNKNSSSSTTPVQLNGGFNGISFKIDGSKMFVLSDNNKIVEHNLTVPYDLGNILYSGNITITGGAGSRQGLFLSDDGTFLIIGRNDASVLMQYDLSTAFKISTAVNTHNITLPWGIGAPAVSMTYFEGCYLSGYCSNNDLYIAGYKPGVSSQSVIYKYSVSPSQISTPEDLVMEFNSNTTRNFNTYFANFFPGDSQLLIEDFTDGFIALVNDGESYGSSWSNISLSNGIITFRTFEDLGNAEITMIACNFGNCVSDEFNFSVVGEGEAPEQIASFLDAVLSYNESTTYNLNNFFTNYNSINVSFPDNGTLQTLSILKSGFQQIHYNGTIQVWLNSTGNNVLLTISAKSTDYQQTLNLNAINNFGSVGDSIGILVNEAGENPVTNVNSGSFLDPLVNVLDFIYPDKDTLTVRQRIGFMIATYILLAIFFMCASLLTGTNWKGWLIVLSVFYVIFTIYFVAISYFNIVVFILIILVVLAVAWLLRSVGAR